MIVRPGKWTKKWDKTGFKASRIMQVFWEKIFSNIIPTELIDLTQAQRISVEVKRWGWNWLGHILRKENDHHCMTALTLQPEGGERLEGQNNLELTFPSKRCPPLRKNCLANYKNKFLLLCCYNTSLPLSFNVIFSFNAIFLVWYMAVSQSTPVGLVFHTGWQGSWPHDALVMTLMSTHHRPLPPWRGRKYGWLPNDRNVTSRIVKIAGFN